MECSNFEKSKGYVSKIPVRAIKQPSRLPVPIATKENEPKKYYTRPNPCLIENVSSKAQVKTKRAIVLPASRKGLPPSRQNRFGNKDSIETVTNRRLTNVSNPTVNKKPAKSELQTNNKVTKVSNQPSYKKPLNKETVAKKLAYAGNPNQNEKPTRDKISDINRKYTNISNKGSTLHNKKPTVVQRNIANQNVDKIETRRHTNFGFRANQKTELEVKQPKEKLPIKGSTLTSKAADKLNYKATKADVKSKKDVSFDQKSNCSSGIQDPPHNADKKNEDKNHFSQAEIEFIADERYRNQILFGQGISPNLKPQPVKNALLGDRPSFFSKSKTALRAIERLEEEGKRASMMRMSGMKVNSACPSSLLYNSPAVRMDPIQGILRALENVDLAAEDRRVSAMKKNNINMRSPCRDQSPFKQQINPYKTVLKKIEALQMKRKVKSTKKVTFNLEPSDAAPKVSKQKQIYMTSFERVKADDVILEKNKADNQCSILKSPPKKEDNHCSISELKPKKSTPELQLSTSFTDKMERNVTQSHYQTMLLSKCGRVDALNKMDLPNRQTQSTVHSDRQTSVSNLNSLSTVKNTSSPPKPLLLPQNAGQIRSNISDSVGPCFRTIDRTTSSALTSEDPRCSLYLSRPQTVLIESDTRRNTLSTINNKSCPLKYIAPQNAAKIGSSIYDFIGPCIKNRSKITGPIVTSEDPRLSLYLSRPQTVLTESDTRRSTLSSYSLSTKSSPPKYILSQNATKTASNVSDSVGPGFRNRNRITSSILPPEDPRFSLYLSRPQTVHESDSRRNTLSSYSLSTMKYLNAQAKSFPLQQKNPSKISDSVGPGFRDCNRITSSILALEDPRCSLHPQTTFESNAKRSTLSRLCTPKPISFFPKPCASDSISPEFLCRRTSQIVAHAPICTPMAMRTLAANLEETLSPVDFNEEDCSPVCQRLDFDEIEKEMAYEDPNEILKCQRVATLINLEEMSSPVVLGDEECSPVCQRLDFDEVEKENPRETFRVRATSPCKLWKFPIQSIRTNQQVLDCLADEECGMILSLASFPVITQRSVLNPVARILTNGDDMHFVPLKLK